MQVRQRDRVILQRCLDRLIFRLQWSALAAWRSAAAAARVHATILARAAAKRDVACQRAAFTRCWTAPGTVHGFHALACSQLHPRALAHSLPFAWSRSISLLWDSTPPEMKRMVRQSG